MDKCRQNTWFLIFLLAGTCFGTLGDIIMDNDGNLISWPSNFQTTTFKGSSTASESVDYIWPPADASSGGQALLSDGSGVLRFGVATTSTRHLIGEAGVHDTTAFTPTRGSLMFGNGTLWDELGISSTIGSPLTKVLGTDETDTGFRTLANFALDIDSILDHDLLGGTALVDDSTVHDVRYYTKDEVNDIVEGNTFDFFLNNTNSDINAPIQYFVMDPTETGEAESTFSDTITGDAFLIDSWATSTSEPTFSALVSGIYSLHIHAETTTGANVGSVRLYWELYKRLADSPFTETLLITSEESNILVGVETEYDIHGSLAADVVLDLTDRLVLKVYANIEVSRPTDPLVTLTAEDSTAAHFEVVTTITAFDDRYVFVTGDTMTGPLIVEEDIKAQTFSIGSGTINETELTFLDGATAGTAGASKAVIVGSALELDIGFGDRTNVGDYDGSVDPAVITDLSPDAYWRGEGNLTLDPASASGVDLGVTGTEAYVDRGTSAAFSVNGSTGLFASAGGGYDGVTGTTSRTISCWMRNTTTGASTRMVATGGAVQFYDLSISSENPPKLAVFTGAGNRATDQNSKFSDGEWHHVVCVHDSTRQVLGSSPGTMVDILLYVDGVLDETGGGTDTVVNTTSGTDMTIGCDTSGTNCFVGDIDEVAVLDKVLTPTEIKNIFNRQKERIIQGTGIPDARDMVEDIHTLGQGIFGTLTVGSGSITDSSGGISFGDEILTIGTSTITPLGDNLIIQSARTLILNAPLTLSLGADNISLDADDDIFLSLGDTAGVNKVIIRDDNDDVVVTIDSDGGIVGVTFNSGTLSGNNSGDQSAGDFSHNSLANLNAGTTFEHLTQTQKDTLHAQGTDTTLGTMTASINMDTFDITGTDVNIAAGTGDYSSSGTVDTTEIFNSGSDLKIVPDVQGDVVLFGDTDVGNDEAGRAFTIHRKAAEFDRSVSLFFNSLGSFNILSTGNTVYNNPTGFIFFLSGDEMFFKIGTNKNYIFRNSSSATIVNIDEESGNLMSVGTITGASLHANDGFSGSWTNAEGDVVTVVDGIITSVVTP